MIGFLTALLRWTINVDCLRFSTYGWAGASSIHNRVIRRNQAQEYNAIAVQEK